MRCRLRPSIRLPNPALVGMAARFLRRLGHDVALYVRPSFHPGDEALPDAYETWVAAQSVPA